MQKCKKIPFGYGHELARTGKITLSNGKKIILKKNETFDCTTCATTNQKNLPKLHAKAK